MGYLHHGAFRFVPYRSQVLKHLQAHPEAKKWRDTPFPYYNEIQELTDGKHATGERAYQASLTSDNEDQHMSLINDVEGVDDGIGLTQLTDATSQVSECPSLILLGSGSQSA